MTPPPSIALAYRRHPTPNGECFIEILQHGPRKDLKKRYRHHPNILLCPLPNPQTLQTLRQTPYLTEHNFQRILKTQNHTPPTLAL